MSEAILLDSVIVNELSNVMISKENDNIVDFLISSSINNGSFINYYQPITSFVANEIIGYEVLSRLRMPSDEIVYPQDFLPVVIKNNLTIKLFERCLERAIIDVSSISDDSIIFINVFKSDFDFDLLGIIQSFCERYKFTPNRLILEINESGCFSSDVSIDNILKIKNIGVKIALDDFGSGCSDFDLIFKLGIDKIKIDREYVKDIISNYEHYNFIKTCINFAHSLGVSCVVEGVEDERTYTKLERLGVDFCQGYHISEPLPLEKIKSFIKKNVSKSLLKSDYTYNCKAIVYDNDIDRSNALILRLLARNLFFSVEECSKLKFEPRQLDELHIIEINFYYSNRVFLESKFKSNSKKLILVAYDLMPFEIDLLNTDGHYVIRSSMGLNDTVHEISNVYKIMDTIRRRTINLFTPRERAVISAFSMFNKNVDVADHLGVSQGTIAAYKSKILKKANVDKIYDVILKEKVIRVEQE
ncbi:EAL domain-containing protein [Vibrio sp. SM6]|uniref:EAL domain-containing protein n=1 Tax=Vibrio agarilyticus TaxID=2726741 RepID=A0A7X8TPG3_9VIBR|nr:EAL domain-containing protein [Vibrio agarilyticus]NLS11803.1 EAL domain-containing protein [Vibrio agarilyticus]